MVCINELSACRYLLISVQFLHDYSTMSFSNFFIDEKVLILIFSTCSRSLFPRILQHPVPILNILYIPCRKHAFAIITEMEPSLDFLKDKNRVFLIFSLWRTSQICLARGLLKSAMVLLITIVLASLLKIFSDLSSLFSLSYENKINRD